ncbi:hypothetical protein POM88_025538 [Heracleum sosnowskyi]|uniref:No apical meristem-associated C-terminal domain-containing protein n=1 Tax=Heracleum sosnowskyi TaxID=360622 RepID=A0AAD8I5F9_9APIA|nr:hypothetical protein POM88_025538 [Heracleum sosnowskyi]
MEFSDSSEIHRQSLPTSHNHHQSQCDKIENAKKMYKEVCKANFTFEHCWKLLRYLPKWNANFATKKSKARKESSTTSSPSTPDCVVLEKSEFERPIERKTAKEMEKKKKRMGNEYDDNGAAAILEQIRTDQLESRKQRYERLKEMIQLAKEREDR